MANREQRSNRENKKPKKEKPTGAPVVSSFTTDPASPLARKVSFASRYCARVPATKWRGT